MFNKSDPVCWLHYADNSYVASRLLWFTGFLLESPVNAHRALELYLKAFLISRGLEAKPRSPVWGHKLAALGDAASSVDASFGQDHIRRRLQFFERYFDFVRYPSDVGSPDDGSLTWFSFDANIMPLDESVAFIRPRIMIAEKQWHRSTVHGLLSEGSDYPHQRRALTDSNAHLQLIDCVRSGEPAIVFDNSFAFDRPGC